MSRTPDLNLGDQFGRLTIIRCIGLKPHGPSQSKAITYHCKCSCETELEVVKYHLTGGRVKSCGCMKRPKDLSGQQVGKWKVIKMAPREDRDWAKVRWECRCECGTERQVLGISLRRGGDQSCGCTRIAEFKRKSLAERQRKGWGEVANNFLHPIKNRARRRGFACTLTLKDISDIYEQQGKKCYLTGLPIYFDQINTAPEARHTASLDRIDSAKEYTLDNVCLVHKDINRMKNAFPLDTFLHYCRLIAATHPDPKKRLDNPVQPFENTAMNHSTQPFNAE